MNIMFCGGAMAWEGDERRRVKRSATKNVRVVGNIVG